MRRKRHAIFVKGLFFFVLFLVVLLVRVHLEVILSVLHSIVEELLLVSLPLLLLPWLIHISIEVNLDAWVGILKAI